MIDVGAVEHLKELIIIDSVPNPFGNSFELFVFNESILIGIINSENSLEAVFGLEVTYSCSNNFEVFFQGKGFVLVSKSVDKVENEGISLIDT